MRIFYNLYNPFCAKHHRDIFKIFFYFVVFQPGIIQSTPKPSIPTLAPINNVFENFSCNFDNGFCDGITQDTNDELDFILNRGNTPSKNTGPSFDHTSGSGKDVIFEVLH